MPDNYWQWLHDQEEDQKILDYLAAQQAMDEANGMNVPVDSYGYSNNGAGTSSGYGGTGSDWISNGLAITGALTNIFNNTKQMAGIGDTSMQRNMIQDIGNVGTSKYGNWGQVMMDYDRLNSMQPDLSYDTIRGGSTKERVGGVLSNTATGAMTGLQVGGPWGALAGGVIGLGAGIGGWIAGDRRAELERDTLRLNQSLNQDRAMRNIAAGIEDYTDYEHRNNIRTLRAEGGQIQRKESSMKEFADRVLSRGRANDSTRSSGVIREKVNGGTKIRIKR